MFIHYNMSKLYLWQDDICAKDDKENDLAIDENTPLIDREYINKETDSTNTSITSITSIMNIIPVEYNALINQYNIIDQYKVEFSGFIRKLDESLYIFKNKHIMYSMGLIISDGAYLFHKESYEQYIIDQSNESDLILSYNWTIEDEDYVLDIQNNAQYIN